MPIVQLRILPPLAIARLGSSPTPLDAFYLAVDPEHPLEHRRIVPSESFEVARDGSLHKKPLPTSIRFKEKDPDGRIRPVAPFLEVFAVTTSNRQTLQPLTVELLKAEGLSLDAIRWNVRVANIKIARRTGKFEDQIFATAADISDHEPHPLMGECPNFLPGKRLPLGSVQFIRPTQEFGQIRLRFTPAAGKVYGSSRTRKKSKQDETGEPDPVITSDELVIYDKTKGWLGYEEGSGPTLTNPGQIFAGFSTDDGTQVSWGYIDDECDGVVEVNLKMNDEETLAARAWIGAGPPAFAPDSLPVRVVTDELEQIVLGPHAQKPVNSAEVEEIVRRAMETVRLMNTSVMNGNPVNGRARVASTMTAQDANDFRRLYQPIMAESLMDNLAVVALHQRILSALQAGTAPWFADVLRRPEEIGDLSDAGRRKMPALMRNADARALTLTHRQIDKVVKASSDVAFDAVAHGDDGRNAPLKVTNVIAQLHHRAAGNPISVLPSAAISNCFPGLEFDFRNLWRRAFEGIVLLECNNYVIHADEPHCDLLHHRLLTVDGRDMVVATNGPKLPNGGNEALSTGDNPAAVSFMEWSNSLAHVLQKQGQEVECEFTADEAPVETASNAANKIKVKLKVRRFFVEGTAEFAKDLLQPGELTQGLCAPWQNDYRECACYYWAASRPDYVNVEPGPDGLSRGDMWMAKTRTGNYIPDNRTDKRLLNYDDLFMAWEKELKFIIGGKDADAS